MFVAVKREQFMPKGKPNRESQPGRQIASKRDWIAPAVHRVIAGSAEDGGGILNDGGMGS